MKKGLLLGLACLFVLTGCFGKDETATESATKEKTKTSEKTEKKSSADTVVCSGRFDESGMATEMKVTATFKAGIVDTAAVSLVFDDKSVAEQYCAIFELANSMAETEEDKVNFTCSGNTLTFKDYSDFAESEDEDDTIIGATKADFIKAMEETDGVTCK